MRFFKWPQSTNRRTPGSADPGSDFNGVFRKVAMSDLGPLGVACGAHLLVFVTGKVSTSNLSNADGKSMSTLLLKLLVSAVAGWSKAL